MWEEIQEVRKRRGKREEVMSSWQTAIFNEKLFVSLSKFLLDDRGRYTERGRSVSKKH